MYSILSVKVLLLSLKTLASNIIFQLDLWVISLATKPLVATLTE